MSDPKGITTEDQKYPLDRRSDSEINLSDDESFPEKPVSKFGAPPIGQTNTSRKPPASVVDTDSVHTNDSDEKGSAKRRGSVEIPLGDEESKYDNPATSILSPVANVDVPTLLAVDLEAGQPIIQIDEKSVNDHIGNFIDAYETLRNHKWGTRSEKFLDFFTPKRGSLNADQEIVDLLKIALKAQPGQPFFPPKWSAHRYDKSFLSKLLQAYIDSCPKDGTANADIDNAKALKEVLSNNGDLQQNHVFLLKAILCTAAESRQKQHLNKVVLGLAKATTEKRQEFTEDGAAETFTKRYSEVFGLKPKIPDDNEKITIMTHKNNQITVPNNKAITFKDKLVSFVTPNKINDPSPTLGVRKINSESYEPGVINTLKNDPNVMQLADPSVFRIEHQEQTYFVFAAPQPGCKGAPPPIAWVVRQKDADGNLQEVDDTRAKQACVDKFMGRLSAHLETPENRFMCTSEPERAKVSAKAVQENTKKLNSPHH